MTYKLAKTSQDADPYFGAVSLLLDGTDLQDKSLDTKAITVNGNAQVSTTQSKWNGSSLYFDGTGDYLTIPTSSDFSFGTGDFTIEFWAHLTLLSSTRILVDFRSSGSSQLAPTIFTSGTQLRFFNSGSNQITGGTLSTSVWYHVAVSRQGTNTRMFLDGVQTGSTYSDSSDYPSRPVAVGGYPYASGFDSKGYIQDLRITKGVARYTANFTPPTQPFMQV